MAQWLLRLTTCEWVASRNTGVHVNILAASLHGPRRRQPSRPSMCTPQAVMQMAQWFLRLITCAWVASRNTGVHVNILAASLHGPRLRQPSAPSVCVPKRLIIRAQCFGNHYPFAK